MIGNWNYGTGRRKSSVARVFIKKGTGEITVNGKAVEEYFGRQTSIMIVKQPLMLTNNDERLRHQGQRAWRRRIGPGRCGAPRHHPCADRLRRDAQARPEPAGFVTRDAREVERKKVGLHGARRRKQFSKR